MEIPVNRNRRRQQLAAREDMREMRITVGSRFSSKLVGSAAFAVLLTCGPVVWAQTASSESVGDLKSEVQELQKEVRELKGEVTTIKSEQALVPPPPADQRAQTIGESVGSLGKSVEDIRTNLSTNLGIQVHGMADVTHEYNFNAPNTSNGSKGGPNPTASGGSLNQLRAFDIDGNGWNLAQFNLHIARVADGGVGFVTDLNFGQLANVMAASTRYSNLNPGAVSNNEFDLTQAYLTYTVPVGSGINLQLGRMVTLLGAEIIPTYANQNFNESRGFLFTLGEPLTHTGLRGTYAFNDKVSMTLGVNNGWDDVSDNNSGQSVEGELTLAPTSNISLVLNGMYGPEQVNRGNTQRWAIDPIATWHTPITGLQLVGEYLYANEGGPVSVVPAYSSHGNRFCVPGASFCTFSPGFPAGPNGTVNIPGTVSWSGAAGYIVYDWNDHLEFATRGEWFDDSNGARSGLRQTLGEITETINYKIPQVTGLLARLEYRHDESSAKPFFGNSIAPSTSANFPNPDHTYSGQDTIMAAAIYSF
jgi:Putative beta-barrel porin-2, OmpL-like. bbp2